MLGAGTACGNSGPSTTHTCSACRLQRLRERAASGAGTVPPDPECLRMLLLCFFCLPAVAGERLRPALRYILQPFTVHPIITFAQVSTAGVERAGSHMQACRSLMKLP